ncbi:MAG TPA: DUF748 domain-containing protein, partial [Burkholderiales bacterium]
MRRGLVALSILASLVFAYAAAGYLLAPRFVHDALVERARAAGAELRIGSVHTDPFGLRVALHDVELVVPQGAAFARRALLDLSWASLWRRGWIVERARVTDATVRLGARLSLQALTLDAHDLSTLDGAPGTFEASARLAGRAEGNLEARGALSLAGGAAVLRELSLSANGLAYGGVRFSAVRLSAAALPFPVQEPVNLAAEASIAPRGKIAARGTLQTAPFALHLDLEADGVPLARAQRWVPVHVASGSVSGKGRLDVDAKRAAYHGSAAVADLRLEERSGALLLAWQRAETASLRVSSTELVIKEVRVRSPEGRLVIAPDGTVNLAAAIPAGGGGMRASVERLRIESGTLQFADRSLATPFEATLRELSGTVSGLASGAGEPARVRLDGRVQPFGVARIRGTVALAAPTTHTDIRASLRNLRLESFNPYVAKFAGYRIASGRLSAELRYEVRDGRLVGANQLAFENMQLGEKLEQKGLLDLPLDLAVALLADSKGRINLDIPVRGDLSDPQFDLGAIVARAVGNVVRRIVSAPFRALAALFGGDGDLGNVVFQPGSAELAPPEEEQIARIAEGLEQRPRATLEVRGAYDPARDLEALRLRAAREDLARAARAKGMPDLSRRATLSALERLYLERGGDRATLRALRKEQNYGWRLLQQLAALTPVDPAAAQALARERAQSVRAGLLDHGVAAERVRMGDTV